MKIAAAFRPQLSARRLSSLVAVMTGKVFTQGSLLICNVIVARMVGVGEFGLYSAALSLVLILDACAGSPLDYTVIRFSAMHGADRQRTNRVLALAFRAKLVAAALLAVLAWGAGPFLAATLLHDASRAPLLWIVAAATATLLLFRGTATFLQSQGRFRDFGTLDVASGALRIALVGGAALLGLQAAGEYLGAFGAAYAVLFAITIVVWPQPYFKASMPDRVERAAFTRFLGATTATIVLGTISGRADILFLAASVPPDALSHYATAIQLASIATLLAGYGSITAQPFLIPALREGRAHRLLAESLVVGSVLGLGFWGVAYLSGDALPSLLFGAASGHSASGGIFPILAAGTALDLICMPVAMTYVLQVRPRAALTAECILTVVFLTAAFGIAKGGGASAAKTMAILVTSLRLAKTIIYVGIMARDLRIARSTVVMSGVP